MAKIYEEDVLIRISKIVREDEDGVAIVTDDMCSTIEQVIGELVADDCVVEVAKTEED